ncbi:hypothetical protein ABPG75_002711 [Micractinium tetrahymenae]
MAYLEAECGGMAVLPQALEAPLNADLKQVGTAALPDDINRADSKKLVGSLVLQVSSVLDISQPSRASSDRERKGRILRLRLTDGRSSCVGIEFQPLTFAIEQLCPGTKVRLRGATVRMGVLLLEARCVELLGGRVEPLAEAWETQQKYGGTTLERADAEADKPPTFRHFDPKLAKYGSRRGQVAAKAAAAVAAASAGPGAPAVALAGAGATTAAAQPPPAQHQQEQQQQRAARRGFQPYQPPVARKQQQELQAAHEASVQRAAPPGGQQQRRQQQQRELGLGEQPQGPGAAMPSLPPSPASAAPAADAALQQPGKQNRQQQQSAATQKLLGRLQVEEGRFGRGPRVGRRSRFDDDADDGSMTLEEWEARQAAVAAGPAPSSQHQLSDEELARQLQRQLDLEAAQEMASHAHQTERMMGGPGEAVGTPGAVVVVAAGGAAGIAESFVQ